MFRSYSTVLYFPSLVPYVTSHHSRNAVSWVFIIATARLLAVPFSSSGNICHNVHGNCGMRIRMRPEWVQYFTHSVSYRIKVTPKAHLFALYRKCLSPLHIDHLKSLCYFHPQCAFLRPMSHLPPCLNIPRAVSPGYSFRDVPAKKGFCYGVDMIPIQYEYSTQKTQDPLEELHSSSP